LSLRAIHKLFNTAIVYAFEVSSTFIFVFLTKGKHESKILFYLVALYIYSVYNEVWMNSEKSRRSNATTGHLIRGESMDARAAGNTPI